MGGGAEQELCFYIAQQLLWDTILRWLLDWDSKSAGDGGGISIPCIPCFPYIILMSNDKKMYLQVRWESCIMVLSVPCTSSSVLLSHGTVSAEFGSWERSCYMGRDLLFFTFQVTLNEWFVALSEYFSISSFKNAFSSGGKREATLTKASSHMWIVSLE